MNSGTAVARLVVSSLLAFAAVGCTPPVSTPPVTSRPVPADSAATRELVGQNASAYVEYLGASDAFVTALIRGRRTVDVKSERARAFGKFADGEVRAVSVESASLSSPPAGIVPSSSAEPGASAAYWTARVKAKSTLDGVERPFAIDFTGQVDSMKNVIVYDAVLAK